MSKQNELTEGGDEAPRPPRDARTIVRDRMNLADSPIAAFTRMIRDLAKEVQQRKR